jgi:hypothetical protein
MSTKIYETESRSATDLARLTSSKSDVQIAITSTNQKISGNGYKRDVQAKDYGYSDFNPHDGNTQFQRVTNPGHFGDNRDIKMSYDAHTNTVDSDDSHHLSIQTQVALTRDRSNRRTSQLNNVPIHCDVVKNIGFVPVPVRAAGAALPSIAFLKRPRESLLRNMPNLVKPPVSQEAFTMGGVMRSRASGYEEDETNVGAAMYSRLAETNRDFVQGERGGYAPARSRGNTIDIQSDLNRRMSTHTHADGFNVNQVSF